MDPLLENRTAVLYGGGGSIGSGVARAFAREGAHVVLTGRTEGPVRAAAESVAAEGGSAEWAVVDALDEEAVEAHAEDVAARRGGIDVSFDLIMRGDVQGTPLIEMSAEDLLRAPVNGLRSAFLTSRAAARRMVPRGSGVILHLNSGSSHGSMAGMGSTGPADAAVETYMRYLAAELGPSGVRVCGIWTAGVQDTLSTEKVGAVDPAATADAVVEMISRMSVCGRPVQLSEVADTAVFLASDRAGGITGSMVNVTAGLALI